jgi:hypothetical protein
MAITGAAQLEKSTLIAELDGAVVAAAEEEALEEALDEALDEVSLTEAVAVLVAKLELVNGVLLMGVEVATGVLETITTVPEGTTTEETGTEVTGTQVEEPIAPTLEGMTGLEELTRGVDEDAMADEETAA